MSASLPVANCLSFDVESFAESNLESFPIAPAHLEDRRTRYEIERNMAVVLELLDGFACRATFFFLGTVVARLPNLIREVASGGHEVASHGYEHLRIFNLREREFRTRLRDSKARLEDVSGRFVWGFRAPEFSITHGSMWALGTLRDLGFVYDSSIYPTSLHDVYGLADGPRHITVLPNGLVEFPLPTFGVPRLRLPFGGGGYFRLYPAALTRALVSAENRAGRPCMLWIHPYEVGPVAPRLPGLGRYRTFRHYHNRQKGGHRLAALLRAFRFAPAIEVLAEYGAPEAPADDRAPGPRRRISETSGRGP